MKTKTLAAVIAVLTGAFIAVILFSHDGRQSPRRIATAGLEAPNFELRDPNGNLFRLSDMRGSVVFVNFWASWCEPCREEMPSIENLLKKTMDNRKFHLVTVLYKDDPQAAYMFLKQNNSNFPMLVDPEGKAAKAYGLTGVPETFLIDGKGILKRKVIGPAKWDDPEFINEITSLTKQ